MSTMPPWNVTILTLFPEMFPGTLGHSLAGKALAKNIWNLSTVQIRDFAEDKHSTVDDKPFGGGAGMVMRPDIIAKAIDSVHARQPQDAIIYFTPSGDLLTQGKVHELATLQNITLLCGRFEGVDQRVLEEYNVQLISLGDFILSGGEIPALALIDACVRLLPGVLGSEETLNEESFSISGNYAGLLEYPHYTRPSVWREYAVPEVLLSGNHGEIHKWRLAKAREITKARRADLWQKYNDKEIKL
jgi:tRNA (guanine37-N1)-methyltransferase